MAQNDEIRTYLDYLVGHERECTRDNCPTCQSARNVYESVRSLLFSGVPYPAVTITARRSSAPSPASGRKASARRAA